MMEDDNKLLVSLISELRNSIRYVGICIYSTTTNEFSLSEYIENDHFTTLESILIQTNPDSLIYLPCNNILDNKRIQLICNLCEIKLCELNKDIFQTMSIETDLEKLIKVNDNVKNYVSFLNLTLGSKALSSIIKYLNLLNEDSAINKCTLKWYNISKYVKLDKAAICSLNINTYISKEQKNNAGGSNQILSQRNGGNTMTLYKFLNRCKTKIGERKLLKWIMHPIRDEKKINQRLDMVEIMNDDQALRSMIQADYLRKVCDLDLIIKKLKIANNIVKNGNMSDNYGATHNRPYRNSNNKCTIEDLVKLYDTVVASKNIYYALNEYKNDTHKQNTKKTLEENFIIPLESIIISLTSFLKLIELTVDFDQVIKNQFLISPNFDDNLMALSKEKEEIYKQILHHRAEVEEDINYLKRGDSKSKNTKNYSSNNSGMKEDVKLIDCNTNVFLFRSVKKDIVFIQQRKKTYNQVRVNKNEILFNTNKLRELCKQYQYALHSYNISQEQLANKAIEVASSYWEPFNKLSKIISQIDIFCSFAYVISQCISTYVRPIVEQNGKILEIRNSRHPLVEANYLQTQNFIPNDIYMDKENNRLNIITGPNMGGKSTYIRQIAIISLMAHIGCFVPSTYAKIPIFSQIMCRIGSSDIQLKGISTFFSEMIEVSAIIKNADSDTLVIIDELGRGTSTYEGFGISWSVANYLLNNIKCLCLFATHFHEISNLEDEYAAVSNNHVSAKIDDVKKKISFLYEIKKGFADKSYGVHVAQIAKLPQKVIDKSFEKSKELESIENKHYFKNKLKSNNDNNSIEYDQAKTEIHNKSEACLKEIFKANNEQEFISLFKKNKGLLVELLGNDNFSSL
ncbi:DNA mismatch repair protein MSH2, putative [Plasmodium vinckei vinckei]|uniref:DNA mismatch repair protein MSH2, putative n=1 Tax=Plasmodium vinckei vinckei TaxID=54757 RepID=A0A449BTB8_PLAVN|nr:DNA mismatch repair protein MSH2, putative [Plasmodium vinckei vinckei]VEV56717.1 DNA mismatch repair protein MSH2, putative [Plasmodium vinckei vinckei]